jgi:hypothetical protein
MIRNDDDILTQIASSECDMLFNLYLARVAKAETVCTMRCDAKAIFRDAFLEAKVALDVWKNTLWRVYNPANDSSDKQEKEKHK